MILNNTQANIFKVNGGIADNFANRPAASGSFYIFYSIDTQEIYYDNGAWVLIGSGGGGVNIYNSDGTLTSQRLLNGANSYSLEFLQLPEFNISGPGTNFNTYYLRFSAQNDVIYTEIVGNGIDGIFIDFIQKIYYLGNFNQGNGTYLDITNNFLTGQNYIKTRSQGNDIGLKLDFANKIYAFGDYFNTNNSTKILIDDNIQYIQLQQSNNVAVNLQFTSRLYGFGQTQAGNQTFLQIDDSLQIIKTINQGNDIGLKLDFANSKYVLGDEPIGLGFVYDALNQLYYFGDYGQNGNFIEYNSSTGIVTSNFGFANQGLRLEMSNTIYQFGQITGGNTTGFYINDTNQIIKTSNQGNDIGLKLDFANTIYSLGSFNAYGYSLDPFNGFLMGDINGTFLGNACYITINNQIIKTKGLIDQGFYLDFANKIYQLGQITGGNHTYLYINDASELLYTANNGTISNGLYCDFAAHVYQFGRANGGNTTYLTINDAAAYPVQLDGTNITSGTAGGASGQHLKIKINGVDYKIELRNP